MSNRTIQATRFLESVEAAAVFLFLYQALRVLLSVLFGTIYDALFASQLPLSTVGLMLGCALLALLAPLVIPRRLRTPQVVWLLAALPVFLARIPLTLDDPQVRLAAATVIVAGAGIYLAARLQADRNTVIRGLVSALVLDQVLRAAGHTLDFTLDPHWLPGQVVASVALCLLALLFFLYSSSSESGESAQPGLVGGLAWGAWLFLETSALAFPNVVSRWSGEPYALVAPLLLAVSLLSLSGRFGRQEGQPLSGSILRAVVLVAGVAGGYVLSGPVSLAALILAQLVALGSLSSLFPGYPHAARHRTGTGLALGGVLFLLLSFAYAFTFTYPYTLALFRGLGWAVVLLAGLVMAPVMFRQPGRTGSATRILDRSWSVACSLMLIMFVVLVAGWRVRDAPGSVAGLRVATYNIHYGYDSDWHLNLEEQARTIAQSGADVVALQEVDTGRPTSYMVDDALWLSRRLDMHAVYLPCVEHLTGIALLTRFPVVDSDALQLPSELEQTGILWAQLDVPGTPLNAFALWLGLEPEERARQLDAALPFIAERPGPAILGGDFNAPPTTPVYRRIDGAGFLDPFAALGDDAPPTSPAIGPTERIDFVWLRDLQPVGAMVSDSLASDHRLVVVEVALDTH